MRFISAVRKEGRRATEEDASRVGHEGKERG